MSAEENKAIVRRVYDEVMNQGDLSVVEELFASEYVYHSPGSPDLHGPDGFRQIVAMYRDAFPDLQQHPRAMIAEGDTVVSRWTASGTHQGELMGTAATGKRVGIDGVVITRLSGGKVVEDWELADVMGLLQQLGAIRAP